MAAVAATRVRIPASCQILYKKYKTRDGVREPGNKKFLFLSIKSKNRENSVILEQKIALKFLLAYSTHTEQVKKNKCSRETYNSKILTRDEKNSRLTFKIF